MGLDLSRYLDRSLRGGSHTHAVRGERPGGSAAARSTRRGTRFLSVVRPRRVVRPGRLLGLPQALSAGRDVEMSEWRGALDALGDLHRIAGASSLDAPLSMSPSFDAPAHLSAVHRGRLVAGPCRVTRDLRHF